MVRGLRTPIQLLDASEISTFDLVFLLNLYAPTRMHRQRLNGACVVDIGAHSAVFSLYAALNGARKVVAIEPVPELADRCRRIAVEAGLEHRVTVVEAAAGVSKGTAVLRLDGENSLASSAFLEAGDTLTVETLPLADALAAAGEPTADYLKFNCEGAEFALWDAMDDRLLSRRCTAVVGWHAMPGLPSPDRLDERIASYGFAVHRIEEPGLHFFVADRAE